MFGSTYGNLFRITTWGESHGKGVGVVVDGCPAGLPLWEEDIQKFLDRRKPGQSQYATPRKEEDTVEILSGIFEGQTTGTPISMMVHNKDQHSKDYSEIASVFRPGHADFTYDQKYGFRDYRGGGRASGRETIGRVAAGAVAVKILEQLHVSIRTYTLSIGPVKCKKEAFDFSNIHKNPLYMPDMKAAELAGQYLSDCMKQKNSSGGIIECVVHNMPANAGDPSFEKLNANLGKAVLSIGAVKGFELGDGFRVGEATGLSNNDPYRYDENGKLIKVSNHSGGILGGISDGSDIILRAAVKPTPSIGASQQTVNKKGENVTINIKGRHDPVIVPRAVVVVESMVALTLVDMLMGSMTSRMDKLIQFFKTDK